MTYVLRWEAVVVQGTEVYLYIFAAFTWRFINQKNQNKFRCHLAGITWNIVLTINGIYDWQ